MEPDKLRTKVEEINKNSVVDAKTKLDMVVACMHTYLDELPTDGDAEEE